jgi:leucyl-tRNA synthetase
MVKKKTTEMDKQGNKYDSSAIESNWQSKWEEESVYQPDMVNAKRPFYNLMMFPYPSAEGLHVGSVFTFSGADVYGRFKRMQGHDVFEPIGLDGFGIHSENHAIKTGTHPMEHAKRTEKNFYRQLREIGNGFDWKHKVETYDPDYYRWTQWIFVQLFKAGLAYRKEAEVNWCPSCKTVLADEQAIEKGEVKVCERCDTEIEKKELEQWFFRITRYADRLLRNIEGLDWTEKVKIAQRNWIGKSKGARIDFRVKNSELKIQVFTTRPDTLFGATFLVVSPEHELVSGIRERRVVDYVAEVKRSSEKARREKTGVFSGFYVINPVNGEEIPVWIADYVLMGYGTGAIMAVPGHDSRDYEFAVRYKLPIKYVVDSDGLIINSGEWDGWRSSECIVKVIDWLEKRGVGKRETTYHLRDWLISRQRYWGPPIPMIFCEKCAKEGKGWFTENRHSGEAKALIESKKEDPIASLQDEKGVSFQDDRIEMSGWYPVEEKDLPVELPFLEDYKPLGTGKSPLANYPEFYEVKCPECGGRARRETDVSDTFLDSAWYFFRYVSNDRETVVFDIDIVKKWLPVSMYIGGEEHSVLHLLYARFITMVLHDLGYIPFEEPFARFYSHGLIIKDGAKMSKSKGNVINPDEYVKKFGADTLRMYLHFLGPFNEGGDFRDTGIEGMHRFLKRVWRLFVESEIRNHESREMSAGALRMMHGAINGVTEDLEGLRYNRAVAKLMSWYNFLAKEGRLSREEAENYLKLLAPFAPHMAEDLWQRVRGPSSPDSPEAGVFRSIHVESWPLFEEKYLQEESVVVTVQVDGKMRGTVRVMNHDIPGILNQENIERLGRERVKKYLEGKRVVRVIYVSGKVINFVVYG